MANDIRRVANFIPGRDSMVEIAPIVARMAGDPSAGTPIARPANIPQQVWSNFVRDAQMETGIMVPFENSQGQTLRANLQRIAESGSRTGRLLAETLLAQNSPHLDMQVEEFTPEDYQTNRAGARGYVLTSEGGTPVRFAMNQRPGMPTESTFIHETLHALTMQWLRTVSTNDPLYVELKSLRDQVKAAAEAQGKTFYGTHPGVASERSALAEFLAESFSRSTFQTFLDTVQVSSNRTGWQAFSQWVARLLGVHDRQGVRALDLALRINEDVMARSAEIARGENAAPAPAPEPTADPYQQARQAIVDLGWEEDVITDFEGRSDEDLESIIDTSRRPIVAEFARQIIARRADQSGAASAPAPAAAPAATPVTPAPAVPSVTEAITRFREAGRQNGEHSSSIDDQIANIRRFALVRGEAEVLAEIAESEAEGDFPRANLMRALRALPNAAAPAPAPLELDLMRDGIQGREIPYTRVPNGSDAFQYAVGTTEIGLPDTVYRRRASERGTYGGWRWETSVGNLWPETAPAPAPAPAADEGARLRQAALDHYRSASRNPERLLEDFERFSDTNLRSLTVNQGVVPAIAAYARHLLQQRGALSPTLATQLTSAQRGAITRTRNDIIRMMRELADRSRANGGDPRERLDRAISAAQRARVSRRQNSDLARRLHSLFNNQNLNLSHEVRWANDRVNEVLGTPTGATTAPAAPTGATTAPAAPTGATTAPAGTGAGRPFVQPPLDADTSRTGIPTTPFASQPAPTAPTAPAAPAGPTQASLEAEVDATEAELRQITYGTWQGRDLDRAWFETMSESELEQARDYTTNQTNMPRTAALIRAIQNRNAFESGRPLPHPRFVAMSTHTFSQRTPTWPGTAPVATRGEGLHPAPSSHQRQVPDTEVVPPTIEQDYDRRLDSARRSGALKRLADFWRTVIGVPGQRMFEPDDIPLDDLKARVQANNNQLTQADLDELKNRYNDAFHRKAVEWAAAHGQPASAREDIITQLNGSGTSASIRLYGVARGNPANPYLRAIDPRTGVAPEASASLGPSNTTVGLDPAPGSSDVAYRVAADMAYLRGGYSRSSGSLMTNNNVRRQVQTMMHGLRLNDPEAFSPMVGSGTSPSQGQQGQPQAYNQLSDEEKIGANVLRTLHNAFINREDGAYLSKARALGNLVLNPDGQTYTAVGDPIDTRGFADGTVVTKQQLEDKLRQLNTFDRSSSGGMGQDILTLSMISQQVLNDFEQNPNANIPEVLVNMARTFGSEAGGWLMSRDVGVTPEVEALLEEHRRPETTPQRRGEINAQIRALQEQERVEPSTPEEMDQEAVARMSEQYGAAQAASEAFRAAGSGRQVLFSMDAAPSDPDVAATPQAQAAIVSQMVSPPSQNEIEIAPRARLGWKERMVEKIGTLLVDKHSTLGRILRILGDISTTKAIDRFEGRRQSQFEQLVRTPLANIENLLNRNNITRQQFEEYLVMRHVREYNTAMARINPLQERNGETTGYDQETRPASGTYKGGVLTTSRADAYMAQEHNEHVVQAARLYDDMMHALQDYAVETGLESRQTVEYWRNNLFPNYVPFRRVLDLEATGGTGAGFSVREGVTHRAMGSSAEIAQVIPSVMELATRIVDRGEKARIAQTLLRTARSRAIPMYRSRGGELRPMWRVDTMPNIRTIVRTHIYNVLDGGNNPVRNSAGVPIEFYNAGDARAFATAQSRANGIAFHTHDAGFQDRVQVRHNPAYINKDNVLIVPENGQNHVLVFDEQSSDAMEMVKGLKNLDSPKLEGLTKAANVFSRWTVGTSTGYNPFFAPINFIRDIQASAVNMNSANVPGWTKGDSVALMGESARNVAPLMRYLQRQHAQLHGNNPRQPTPLPGTPEGWMEFAKRSGGLTGVRESFSTFEDNVRQAQHLFSEDLTPYAQEPGFRVRRDWAHGIGERAEAAGDTFGRWLDGDSRMRVARILSNVPVTINNLNNAFELATRTAAFKMAYEKFVANGMSQQRAAEEAAVVSKNVSVNFNRRGNLTAQMNALFPFFNAAMQGSARLAELLFKKEQFRNEFGAMEERTSLTSAGKKLLYALPALGGMQALLLAAAGFDDGQPPDYEKDRNFIIPLGGKTYGKIPLPLGLNALFNMGRNGMEAMLYPKNALKHAQSFFLEPFSAFNPLGGTPNWMLQLTPSMLDIPVALMMNKDFANRPIFKEDRDPRRPTPGFTRHKEGTSQLSIGIAEMLNNLTGGNEYRPGLINYTGDQIEYVFGQIGGGMTREAMKTGQFVAETATGSRASEDRPWYKVPLASRFVGSSGDTSAVRSDLYAASAELNALNAEYEGLKDDGKRAEAAAFLKEHPEIKLRPKVEKYFNAEGKMRKERQAYQSEGEGAKVAEINTKMRTKGEKLLEEIEAIKSRAAR